MEVLIKNANQLASYIRNAVKPIAKFGCLFLYRNVLNIIYRKFYEQLYILTSSSNFPISFIAK